MAKKKGSSRMCDRMLSISETAKLLEVCENTLRDWDVQGKFKAERTDGGHRRYTLEQVRGYLDKNPPKVVEQWVDDSTPLQKVINDWKNSCYLENAINLDDRRCLSVLLNNCSELMDVSFCENKVSKENMLWLTKEVWLRVKFRRMISVQPMLGPASLIFTKKDGVISESEAVCAKTLMYQTKFFNKADFDYMKEIYADSLALEIDGMILERLPKLNYEVLIDAEAVGLPLDWDVDYIISPKPVRSGKVDYYNFPVMLNPRTYTPMSAAGKYPKSCYESPVFAPYVLIMLAPTLLVSSSVMIRAGWSGENKSDEIPLKWGDNDE